MKKAALPAWLFSVVSLVVAAEFRVYPGATAEDFAAWQKKHPDVRVPSGMHVERYVTPDSLEKVVGFYTEGTNEAGPARQLKLQSGEEIQMRTFILDGAKKDIATSKLYVRIQRPYVDYITPELRGEGVKQLTVIELIRRD